jgi:lactose/L-arabinose transport system ATP-binding protein
MAGLQLTDIKKAYGKIEVIHGVDLEITDGEFVVFVGPSGCGKSTLLRMIAGLEETTSGQIDIGNRDVTHVDPAERGIAMVFQTYALYPHMTVKENISFGLRMNKVPQDEIDQKVAKASEILKLDQYLDRKPKALSGGQRQRVAIGRSIVRGPEVFLFDEPLSNLDAELRLEMRVEIARLHKELGTTMIYVTHDQVEAMTLADKIVVLRDGLIEQVGAPLDLYENPGNKFVAGFIGSPAMNFLSGQYKGGDISVSGLPNRTFNYDFKDAPADGAIELGLRPEHIETLSEPGNFSVDLVEELGGVSYIYLSTDSGEKIISEKSGRANVKTGDRVSIQFDAADVLYFNAESGQRLYGK